MYIHFWGPSIVLDRSFHIPAFEVIDIFNVQYDFPYFGQALHAWFHIEINHFCKLFLHQNVANDVI